MTRPEDILNSIERRGLVSKLDTARLTIQMFVDQAWTWYWSKYGVHHDIPRDKSVTNLFLVKYILPAFTDVSNFSGSFSILRP